MLALSSLLAPPSGLEAPGAAEAWFAEIASRLLGTCRLQVAGVPHRLVEIEFYFDSEAHPDPFTHRHPEQAHSGRWYFHRIGASYRGGSFKGLDLTLGDGVAHGGILLRSLEAPGGRLVVGPSLCVDYLLEATRSPTVAALASAQADLPAFAPAAPLSLSESAAHDTKLTMFRTARVGLSLKRHRDALAIDRLARRYRFLTEPRRITKGRAELIAALLTDGYSPEDIRSLTGSPRKAIAALA